MSMITLVPSAARTVSGDSGFLTQHFEVLEGAIFILDVTAAGSVAGDTLNVYVQHSPADGAGQIVDDFVWCAQVLGDGGTKLFFAYWLLYGGAPSTPLKVPQDATLTAGVQMGPISTSWRVKWVIVNGGGTHSFTFSLSVQQWQSG